MKPTVPECRFNLIHTSKNVVYTNIQLSAKAAGTILPKNTDVHVQWLNGYTFSG